MSSYLDNLVLRTRSLAPVVKPRLASAFETSVATKSVMPVARSEETTGGVRPVIKPLEAPDVQTTKVQVPIKEPQPAENKIAFVESLRSEPPRVAPTTEVRTIETHRVEKVSESTIPQSRIITPTVITPEQETFKAQPAQQRSETPHAEPDYWKSIETRVRQTVKDELPATAPLIERTIKPAVVQPQVVSQARETAVRPPSPKSIIGVKETVFAPATPPEIIVTIGRVDVRAVLTPPTQPARRESSLTSAPSSLDQYLKARSEGRR